MKLYQLIKDLQDEGATEALTHLITLGTLITRLESYVSESDNEARAWDITVRYKDALKEPVTFSMFDKKKGTLVFFKGLKKEKGLHFERFVNSEIDIYPSNQRSGITIYDKELNPTHCHTFKELVEATKNNPFEIGIKDPEI